MEILSDATFKGNLKVEGPLVVSDVYLNDALDRNKRLIYSKNGDTVMETTEILFGVMTDMGVPSDTIKASDLFSKLKKIDINGCSLQTDLTSINNQVKQIQATIPHTGDLYFGAIPSDCTRFKINTYLTMGIDMDVNHYIHSIQLYRADPDVCSTVKLLKPIYMDFELLGKGCEIIFNKPAGEAFNEREIVAKFVYTNRFGSSGAISSSDWPSLPDGWFGG